MPPTQITPEPPVRFHRLIINKLARRISASCAWRQRIHFCVSQPVDHLMEKKRKPSPSLWLCVRKQLSVHNSSTDITHIGYLGFLSSLAAASETMNRSRWISRFDAHLRRFSFLLLFCFMFLQLASEGYRDPCPETHPRSVVEQW